MNAARVLLAVAAAALTAAAPSAGGADRAGIVDLAVEARAGAATLRWTTAAPTRGWVELGLDRRTAVWAESETGTGRSHRATIRGLARGETYRYRVVAAAGTGLRTRSGVLRVPPPSRMPRAGTSGRVLLVDGEPFFPVLAWTQCPKDVEANVALGVNVFLGTCQWVPYEHMLATAAGRAFVLLPIAARGRITGEGLLGWHQPDEADGFGKLPHELVDPLPSSRTGRTTFFTLSAHFPREALPVNGQVVKALYPQYAAKAEVVGFDYYPLAKYCATRWQQLANVYGYQRQLNAIARGKPTYQWIETTPMESECAGKAPTVTPAYVRAEAWLAIAGGANGLGFFTWTFPTGTSRSFDVAPEIRAAVAAVTRDVRALQPALLGRHLEVGLAEGGVVKAGARRLGGATYVIAVNASTQRVRTRVRIPGAATGEVRAWGEGRTLPVRRGVVLDRFAPLGVHVYVATPAYTARRPGESVAPRE